MGIVGVAVMFGLLAAALLGIRAMWRAAFTAGALAEARWWLAGVDSLRPPNWQSLIVGGKDMTPEQAKLANQIYVQAYSIALLNIKEELADARREAVEKEIERQERELRRFEGR
jgi:hypothetical protein